MLVRLKQFIDSLGISIRVFEASIGSSSGVISRAISKNTDIQAKWIQLIAENYHQLDMNWLLTGNGPMLRDGLPIPEPTPATEPPDAGREALYKELLAEAKRDMTDLRADYEKKIAARDEKIEKLNRQLGAAEAKLGEHEARGFRPEDLGGVRPADFPYTTSGKNPYRK